MSRALHAARREPAGSRDVNQFSVRIYQASYDGHTQQLSLFSPDSSHPPVVRTTTPPAFLPASGVPVMGVEIESIRKMLARAADTEHSN